MDHFELHIPHGPPPSGATRHPAAYRYRYDSGQVKDEGHGRVARIALDFEVHHQKGGVNHFHGSHEARGVELSITLAHVYETHVMHTYGLGDGARSGTRIHMLDLPRRDDGETLRVALWLDDKVEAIGQLWFTDHPAAIAKCRALLARAATELPRPPKAQRRRTTV